MNTVERILSASLLLLNEQGAASVTTNAIADAADLSVGNLYYHFHNKDDILLALFHQFEQDITPIIDDEQPNATLTMWTHWWQTWFNNVENYGFLFHDHHYLLHRNQHLKFEYDKLVGRLENRQYSIFHSLKQQNELIATEDDILRIAREVTFIAVFWQDFHDLRRVNNQHQATPYTSALQQILGLLLPYLKANAQLDVEQLMHSGS